MTLLPRLGLRRWLAHKVHTPIEAEDDREGPAMARRRRKTDERAAADYRVCRAVLEMLRTAIVTPTRVTWCAVRPVPIHGYTSDDARRVKRIVSRHLRLDRNSFYFNVDTQTHHAHPLTPGVAGFYRGTEKT